MQVRAISSWLLLAWCLGLAFRGSAQTASPQPSAGKSSAPTLGQTSAAQGAAHTPPAASPWRLVWSDEFNGGNGSAPDKTKWVIETGGNGWGNHELEYYTNRVDNLQTQDGKLVITARQEGYSDSEGVFRGFTSARIKTQGKFSQRYGRIEARIQIPRGQGLWPAFWMLGDDFSTVKWPACGEIDIMENIGKEPDTVHGTIHGPGYADGKGIGSPFTLPDGEEFAEHFHVYAIEWEPKTIRFYVDDHLYATRTPADLPAGGKWVFEHPFFLILNVAVGGDWPGDPSVHTRFPQTMLVDYVRVYEAAAK